MGRLRAEPSVQARSKASGPERLDVSGPRHFFVTELFRSGAPAPAIQQLAGHAELTTTQLYADLDANDLRSAIERIDGDRGELSSEGGLVRT